jgi:hypothetical protein
MRVFGKRKVTAKSFLDTRSSGGQRKTVRELGSLALDDEDSSRTLRTENRKNMPVPQTTETRAAWEMLVECACTAAREEKLAELARIVKWERLLDLAEDHGVLGQVATQLGKLGEAFVSAETKRKLTERYRGQLFSGLRMTGELFRLVERFAKEKIGILTVKGPALAVQAYGDPGMRSYGDIDLLVRQKDIFRATEIMIADGFEAAIPLEAIKAGKIPGQYFFGQRESKLIVELHNEFTLRYFPRRLPLEKLFSRQTFVQIDGREVPTLCVEDMLVLICIHGAKHFWDRLMWIADVAALVTWQTEMDWELVYAAAGDVGAERMVNTGLCLAARMLRMKLPAEVLKSVEEDRVAGRLAKQIAESLSDSGETASGLLGRALFRIRMRGEGLFPGVGYLMRLSFSPTEEDWGAETENNGNKFAEMAGRPFRLARKYGKKN